MPVDLPQLDAVNAVLEAADRDAAEIDVVGPWGAAKTVVALQAAAARGASLLVVTPGRADAEAVYEDLCTFAAPARCALMPAWEVLPTEAMAPADDVVAERMDALKRLAGALEHDEPLYTAIPVRALLQYVVPRDALTSRRLCLSVGQEHDLEDLLATLVDMGYRRELMVEQRGEMSVRGAIFDLFPISGELPYRLEFFGDEIESIRRFEPETQRSVDHVDTFQILPRSEKSFLAKQASGPGGLAPITQYLPANALIALDEPLNVAEDAHAVERQCGDARYFMDWDRMQQHLGRFTRLSLSQLAHDALPGAYPVRRPMESLSGWARDVRGFWEQLHQWERECYSIILICNNTGERKRLYELLEEQGYAPGQGDFHLRVEIGRLRAGFVSPADRLAVLSEREVFGRHYVRRVRRRFEAGTSITAFSDLRAGDYIVHGVHGIGRYEGLRRFAGKPGDFLAIRYAGGDMLYVPAGEIDQVQKYIGGDGAMPKIDKLGGASWARTKKRVKKAVHDMTEELVKLYAAREAEDGHAFSPDTPWQAEFEDAFEYEETPDQARAISEVKGDMESPRPMDRLLCGDVGYGKTEVALRAAFKAVMDGRQAAVLVPTTVLAQQHYATFTERLADYPLRVEVLSRFRSAKDQIHTIDGLKSGEVDVVIGTHRLLSKDLAFKNLGLLVIDEEQRFGVAQKEKIKRLRTHVDVLTMTATPIPRTLHLSLMGSRDMSVINTAPNDRLPIHTCIDAFDEDLIREAIRREVAREGQVFFVHNRVQTILSIAEVVRRLVPDVRMAVAHGQMPERQLERVMTAFIRKETDVLVCTTIIGSGLDIPNANTIIINRADRFGLAELYQLRGRVGRYKHRAFAYLLIPGDRVPSEDAQKRLKALEEFSALGAGFRVAMRDLEIRGCGNILGGEQHGHIAAVGYDTYTQLIQEAVAELKGQPVIRRTLPPFEIAADAYVPEAYVPSEAQKITLYKRISGILSIEAADEMYNELADRFGRPPAPVKRLIDIMRVRAVGADVGVKTMSAGGDRVSVEFLSSELFERQARNALKEAFGPAIEFAWQDGASVSLRLGEKGDPVQVAEHLLRMLSEF